MTVDTVPCKRPKVTVTGLENGSFLAECHVPGCGFRYPSQSRFHACKSDAAETAARHRRAHRDAVPWVEVLPAGAGRPASGRCACGWVTGDGVVTRTDIDASLASHLSRDHGLVTCG